MRLSCESAPTTASPWRRLRALRTAFVVVLALGALCWGFDWNWCRPLIQDYVMSRSGRSFEFDDVTVHFRDGLDPTVEFRELTIQNAPWAASKAPLIHAGHIAVSISWRSLGSDMTIVNLIELDDAQVDVERLADGLRNWRITRPGDRGPARVRVLAVNARNSSLHAIHRGIDLEIDASTAPLPAAEPFEGHPELPLTKTLSFKGRFRDNAFEGSAHVSDLLVFGATSRRFSFSAQASSGGLELVVSGLSNDAYTMQDVDCDVKLSATGAGASKPLPEALAPLRPLVAQGHLARSGQRWTGSDVRVRAGRNTSAVVDAVFIGSFKNETPRPTLKATLRDAVIDVADLSALRGNPSTGGRTLSTQPFSLERMRDMDADINLRPVRIIGTDRSLVQDLRTHATLSSGVLKLQALAATIAHGHVFGSLQIDASRSPTDVTLDLAARGLNVDLLSTPLSGSGALSGELYGRAVLKSRGESVHALLAATSGSIALSLADGASVSKRVDAKLGLNGGEWLRTLFDKSARVPVQCAAVTLGLDHGVATPRRFVFETPETALAVQGSLDIANETIDATLTPARKKLALLALDRSIHAEGPWHRLKVKLAPASDEAPERCTR